MTIETEREEGRRWMAEVMEIPGALAYGKTREAAIKRVKALAEDFSDLAVIAERRNEPTIPHAEFLRELKKDGILL